MARIVSRALPFASRSSLPLLPPLRGAALLRSAPAPPLPPAATAAPTASLLPWRGLAATPEHSLSSPPPFAGFLAGIRGFRRGRRGQAAAKRAPPQAAAPPPPPKESEIELYARIGVEEDMPDDPEVMNIIEILKLNVPMVMKIALDGLLDSNYNTRDTSISDVGKYEKVEVSVLLCNDNFIQHLNKEWRGEDCTTDMLSMSHYIPDLDVPILMLGDIVISVETAARQAEERGLTLLDEVRVQVVRGLLHLLGFHHEASDGAAVEMEKEEQLILKSLRWKGKGLAKSAQDSSKIHTDSLDGQATNSLKKACSLRFYRPKFKYIFCDMDGTLLNSKSQVTARNAEALREARSRGVNIVIATGKARPAVIDALSTSYLSGRTGIVSESLPGVFLQGLLVYGMEGREIYKRNLDQEVCREALLYSLEHKIPLVAFSQDHCYSMFDHPLVDSLHYIYHEPKAKIVSSVDQLLGTAQIQVMAIGDGENDIEMLQLASLGVALANGSEKTKAVANVIGATNDEDGVAQAIYEYAF
ncbi:endoribonuclease YBEY, chloroplastic-like isoform X2 [Phragmites australis]|uniref:endoribonuclease YBEY, chloroplastic-like isoform X2 n=1 Tax=Phragmites australis TaxID=29695 RepID=UPI002D78D709|nr:endoribonuclease YBEY, chloroplastic-like isoform X2 [Phragmites australis]